MLPEVAEAKQSLASCHFQFGLTKGLTLALPSCPRVSVGWVGRGRRKECSRLCHYPEAREGHCLLTTSLQAVAAAGWQLGQSKNKAYFRSLSADLQGDLHLPFDGALLGAGTYFIPSYASLQRASPPHPGWGHDQGGPGSSLGVFSVISREAPSSKSTFFKRPHVKRTRGLGAPPAGASRTQTASGVLDALRAQGGGFPSRLGCAWKLRCRLSPGTPASTHCDSRNTRSLGGPRLGQAPLRLRCIHPSVAAFTHPSPRAHVQSPTRSTVLKPEPGACGPG